MMRKNKQNRMLYASLVLLLVGASILIAVASTAARRERVTVPEQTESEREDEGKLPLETILDKITDKVTESLPTESVTEKQTEADTTETLESEQVSITVDDIVFTSPADGAVLVPCSLTTPMYSVTMDDYRTHSGVDITASLGDSVVCCADGVVTKVWDDPMMGMSVSISHGAGVESVYKNLAPELAEGITEGASVTAGQVIGCVGESALIECEEESHLHFELTVNGKHVDPAEYIEMVSINEVYED